MRLQPSDGTACSALVLSRDVSAIACRKRNSTDPDCKEEELHYLACTSVLICGDIMEILWGYMCQ